MAPLPSNCPHSIPSRSIFPVDRRSHATEEEKEAWLTGRYQETAERASSFASYVLTSLRKLPWLELAYAMPGASHAVNLYPMRHCTHLRSLVLLLGHEPDFGRAGRLKAELGTALLALPNLVDLTVARPLGHVSNLADTFQRLASGRLLHDDRLLPVSASHRTGAFTR